MNRKQLAAIDPKRERQYLLTDNRLPAHLRNMGAPAVWRAGWRGEGVGIAIVDTGVDMLEGYARRHLHTLPSREDLAVNPSWDDVVGNYWRRRVPWGRSFAPSRDRRGFIDEFGHGTKMAAIVGARPGFDGVVGLVPRGKLYNFRVVDWKGRVAKGALLGASARIVRNRERHSLRVALFALDEQVWEREGCAAVKQLLRDLDGADVVTVVAASDSRPSGRDIDRLGSHPGRLARDLGLGSVLVVAAHDGATPGQECLTTWSNYGRETVHLAAPGREVAAASPMGPIPAFGTSAAGALVAGAAALVAGDGRLSAAEVCKWICEHVRKAPSLKDKTVTGGVLDLAGLVKKVASSSQAPSRAASRDRRRASGPRERGRAK